MYFLFLLYFSPLKGWYWHRNKMVSWFVTLINLQTVLYRIFLESSWEVDVNWLLVIIKSYVKVNFKERNNNNNNGKVWDKWSVIRQKCESKTEVTRKQSKPKFLKNEISPAVFLLPPFWNSLFCLITDEMKTFAIKRLHCCLEPRWLITIGSKHINYWMRVFKVSTKITRAISFNARI